MGSRLRKLKALWGEKKLSDGKTIGGKGRLTDAIISKLTTFYGNAIRANSHNVNEMRQAVWAVWAHTSSTDDEPKHWFCPKGKNSWCKYNVSVHNNTVNEFSHKNTLPKAVSEVIKPVFKDLSHLKLLRRCLGGKTQNANESLNSLIWKYSPKLIGSVINVTKIAAFIAAWEYNDGSKNRIDLMRALNLKINKTNVLNCVNIDKVRKSTAKRQVSKTSFEARKAKKLKILKQIEQCKLAEGNIYAAGTFLKHTGKKISRKPVARRLRGGGGLYARRPVVCVPLTRQHRTSRLQWCRERHNWTEQDWACVLFSDEKNIQEKDRYPTCSIMVWAGIMINGRTRLHVVANGTMTGQRYIDEVLLPHVRLFRGAVGDKFVFMDDNATCHRTLAVQDCLDSGGIQRLVWPARSPDLNPIENVWGALGRQVAGRNYPPTNKNTLIRALTEEWDKLPQQLLDNVVQSMVRRVECCITLHGGHIPY
ncbi:transposable element Tc3 transposase [Trichonephila clavipes]|nr:transposable element Tc3 transposase [Trichonephila clavipes]